jgi:Holliday junction resolvase
VNTASSSPNPHNLIQFNKDDFIDQFQLTSGLKRGKVERLVSHFTLTRKKIKKEGFPNWRSPREVTIVRRPLIQFEVDGEKMLLFSPSIAMIASGLFYVGSTKGFKGREIERIVHRRSREFEQQVSSIADSSGLDVKTNFDTEVGEIDVLAYQEQSETLFVIECKSTDISLDLRLLKYDVEVLEEWDKKIKGKAEYLRTNGGFLLSSLGWSSVQQVIPVIVTERHHFSPPDWTGTQVVHVIDLSEWITK